MYYIADATGSGESRMLREEKIVGLPTWKSEESSLKCLEQSSKAYKYMQTYIKRDQRKRRLQYLRSEESNNIQQSLPASPYLYGVNTDLYIYY